MSWSQKRADKPKSTSNCPVEVYPDILNAAEWGEQPRSWLYWGIYIYLLVHFL